MRNPKHSSISKKDKRLVRDFTAMADILKRQGDKVGEREVRAKVFRLFNRSCVARLDCGNIQVSEELHFIDLYAPGDGFSVFEQEAVVVELELRQSSPLYFDLVELLRKYQEV